VTGRGPIDPRIPGGPPGRPPQSGKPGGPPPRVIRTGLRGEEPALQVSGPRLNLYDWQASNIRNSYILAAVLVGLVVLLGWAFGMAYAPEYAGAMVAISFAIGGGLVLIAYHNSDKAVLAIAGVREATVEEHRYLVNVTDAVALGAGVPMPKLYIIDTPMINAFATGRDPQHGVIAVTTGLLKALNRQEVEGVVAHEMAHIKNYDIRFGSFIAATVGALIVLREILLRTMIYSGGGRSSRGGRGRGGGNALFLVLAIVLAILAPILARIVELAISRRREYLADATGAFITRNPEGLASALEKIGRQELDPEDRKHSSEALNHLYFVNPLAHFNGESLFATHPPIRKRVQALRRLSG
jgi:heat shock protein HtpX